MNRKNQIIKDFALLLDDSRLTFANVVQSDETTRFDVLMQTARKAGVSYYYALDLVASVTLENDYSNIIESAAEVLSRHPYRDNAPLMRLRRSTLSGKERYTLGITATSNLEFFGCKNHKCSDELGNALMWVNRAAVNILYHNSSGVSAANCKDEHHLRLILNKDA